MMKKEKKCKKIRKFWLDILLYPSVFGGLICAVILTILLIIRG